MNNLANGYRFPHLMIILAFMVFAIFAKLTLRFLFETLRD
jgi:hypothetical protein